MGNIAFLKKFNRSICLEQMGAGSTAIAAAASQALAATHYNVQTGRRSNSLKASFEAISQGLAMKVRCCIWTNLFLMVEI